MWKYIWMCSCVSFASFLYGIKAETRTRTTLHQNRSMWFSTEEIESHGSLHYFWQLRKNKCCKTVGNYQFYIGDPVESLYLSCIGFIVCGRVRFVSHSVLHPKWLQDFIAFVLVTIIITVAKSTDMSDAPIGYFMVLVLGSCGSKPQILNLSLNSWKV